jgi:hypothetical protein
MALVSSRTQFGVSINVWRLAGETLTITCKFLFCNHQVRRDFLITLYVQCLSPSVLFKRHIGGSGGVDFNQSYRLLGLDV